MGLQENLKSPRFTKLKRGDAFNLNASLYRLMANPVRLAILNLLYEGEISVDELTTCTKRRKVNISQHLAILRHAGLVVARREGKSVYYHIIDKHLVDPCKILSRLRRSGKVR